MAEIIEEFLSILIAPLFWAKAHPMAV